MGADTAAVLFDPSKLCKYWTGANMWNCPKVFLVACLFQVNKTRSKLYESSKYFSNAILFLPDSFPLHQSLSIFLPWRNSWNSFQVSRNPGLKIVIPAAHSILAWSVGCNKIHVKDLCTYRILHQDNFSFF